MVGADPDSEIGVTALIARTRVDQRTQWFTDSRAGHHGFGSLVRYLASHGSGDIGRGDVNGRVGTHVGAVRNGVLGHIGGSVDAERTAGPRWRRHGETRIRGERELYRGTAEGAPNRLGRRTHRVAAQD